LLDEVFPSFAVKLGEGLVVVAVEGRGLFAFEFGQRILIPEDDVMDELAYGVVAFAVGPFGLLGVSPATAMLAGTNQSSLLWVVLSCSRRMPRRSLGALGSGVWATPLSESRRSGSSRSFFMADLPGRLAVEVRLSHPSDKNNYVARVGHPAKAALEQAADSLQE
jgi:hypothetical protein